MIAGLALGAIPFMLGDALLTDGGRARFWRVGIARGVFVAWLALAIALDLEALFFLVIILPVIVLFFRLFGTMAGWVGRQTGLPAAAGLGLGLVLDWALGVTFPMFDSGSSDGDVRTGGPTRLHARMALRADGRNGDSRTIRTIAVIDRMIAELGSPTTRRPSTPKLLPNNALRASGGGHRASQE